MFFDRTPEFQHVDQTGKTRAIRHKGFWFFTEPLHPFPCPIEEFEENDEKNIEEIKNIKKEHFLHRTTKGAVMGIVFQEEGKFYYAPIKYSGNPSEFEYSYLDIRVGKKLTEYKRYLENEKLAKLLKSYCLCYFARHRKYNYLIDPLHDYDLNDLKKPYSEESSVFRKKKLVFPSEKIFEACKSFVQVKNLNDPFLLDSLVYKKRLYGIYDRISDYKNFPNQIIFSTSEAYKNFILSSSSSLKTKEISEKIIENTVEPYLFQNKNVFDNRLVLIQNVDNSYLGYERARKVVDTWVEERVNLGYNASAEKGGDKKEFYHYEKYKGDFSESFVCLFGEKFMAVLEV